MENDSLKIFNPEVSFFRLPIVWGTLILIMLVATSLIAIATYGTNSQVCGTSDCYNNFISQFKLPLGILSLLIPTGAIFAVQHRSEQSIAQIRASEGQNNFVNYYKHLEEFQKYVKLNDLERNSFINKTHAEIFSGCRDGNFNINSSTKIFIEDQFVGIYLNLRTIEKECEIKGFQNERVVENLNEAKLKISNILNKFHYTIEVRTLVDILAKSNLSLDDVFTALKNIKLETKKLHQLFIFCHAYTAPISMQALSKITTQAKIKNIDNKERIDLKLDDCGNDGRSIIVKVHSIPSSSKVYEPTIQQG